MTWVVGGNMICYSYLIADVRVSFSNHESLDCLQKIHILNDDMICGFSGGVWPCLHLVEYLKNQLTGKEAKTKNESGELLYRTIPSLLKNEYAKIESRLNLAYKSVSLIVVSRWADVNIETKFGKFPLIKVFKYRHPHFEAETNWKFSTLDESKSIPEDFKIFQPDGQVYFIPLSIGSGSTFKKVDELLKGRAWDITNDYINGNSKMLEAQFDTLALSMRSMVENSKRSDVGKIFQVGILSSRSTIKPEVADRKYFDQDETPETHSTLVSYTNFCKENGFAESEATC